MKVQKKKRRRRRNKIKKIYGKGFGETSVISYLPQEINVEGKIL